MKKDNQTKNIISAIVSVFLIILTSVMGLTAIKNSASDQGVMQEEYRNRSQVVLYSGALTGRGVIVGADDDFIDILTTKHLIRDGGQDVSVEFANKKKVKALAVYVAEGYDAALVRVVRSDAWEAIGHPRSVEYLNEDEYNSFAQGEDVYYLEYVYDDNLSVLSGTWSETNEYIVSINTEAGIFKADVRPGMSGEGLFDSDDRLIGIIIAAGDGEGAVIPAYKLLDYGVFKQ